MFNRVRALARPSSSKLVLAIMAGTALAATSLVPGSAATQSAAAATPAGVTPTGISITSGAVCTGASGGETIPASITLPTPYVNNNVDVSLLLDDTGSFSGEWSSVASTFSSVVDQLQAAAPSVTFGFGVSMFKDYGGAWTSLDEDDPQTRPYILNQPIVTSATAGSASALDGLISSAVGLADELPGDGGDTPEASMEGLYQLATGAGFDGNGNGSSLESGAAGALATQETPGTSGDVPPFSSNVAATSGTLGGIGWRPGALHIAIIATDTSPAAAFPAGAPIPSSITSANGDSEPTLNFAYSSLTPGDSRTGYVANTTDPATNTVTGAVVPEGGATVQATVNALNALGIRVIGMGPGDAPTTAEGPDGNSSSIWLSSIARLTGATDSSGNPLVFDTSVDPTDLATAIVNNIETSAKNPVNVGVTATGQPTGVSVSFSPSVVDDVAPGATANFNVTIKGNGASTTNGTFTINFVDAGSGAQLGTLPVTISCATVVPKCPGYVFLGARGSGEDPNPTYNSGDYGMGAENYATYLALTKLQPNVHPVGVYYPAVSFGQGLDIPLDLNGVGAVIGVRSGLLGKYWNSVGSGVTWLRSEIVNYQSRTGCSGTQFFLSGYSQGAQVVADTIQGLPTRDLKLVAGVVLFGDPQFNPKLPGDNSTYDPDRYGVLTAPDGPRQSYPQAVAAHVYSFCHMNDPVCQADQRGFGGFYYLNPTLFMYLHQFEEHKNYGTNATQAGVLLWAGLVP